MSEYIFENKDKKEFQDCTGDEMKAIVPGVKLGQVDSFSGGWFKKDTSSPLSHTGIYRVRKPPVIPNQISWWLVPPEYKYLFSAYHGGGVLATRIPVEEIGSEGIYLAPGTGSFTQIRNGQYGFQQGTLESIDSLLIRPIGE